MFDLIQGLETVEAVKTDEDGNVYIFYTITDEFMLQNNLRYKHRVFELDLYNSNQPTFLSYAIAVEPDDEEN